ncbi:hypothetical protein CAter282_1763 [Collimonas arenae]|uniref:Uncharacterized protein n=1 Tax=Collimonas arenae TaxID=279058 RepID=A0A127QHJ3_9BURK|nr:DUF5335 family protein [Collimonas arenae]AMO99641.1 hypothetical protein CAter10_1900 [Collimonas arenae]AMP09539.1 hypothetical protein CAter282_1763 [Collimonas arenae]
MVFTHLEKTAWHDYFHNMSAVLEGKSAEIEVGLLSIGNQVEVEWLPLLGIVYDGANDTIEIMLEGIGHLIHKPKEVLVEQHLDRLVRLEVIDSDDFHHLVNLRDPLMLPAA